MSTEGSTHSAHPNRGRIGCKQHQHRRDQNRWQIQKKGKSKQKNDAIFLTLTLTNFSDSCFSLAVHRTARKCRTHRLRNRVRTPTGKSLSYLVLHSNTYHNLTLCVHHRKCGTMYDGCRIVCLAYVPSLLLNSARTDIVPSSRDALLDMSGP